MPSEQVYRTFQDQQGFMWFCTDRGLSKFDGSNFSTLSVEHGLPDNVVLRAKEDENGAFYCMTLGGKFFILDSGMVKDAPRHNALADGLVGNGILGYSIDSVNPVIYATNSGIWSYQFSEGDVRIEPIRFDENSQITFHKDLNIWAFNNEYGGNNSYSYLDKGSNIEVGVSLDELDWQRIKTGLNIPQCSWLKTGDDSYLLTIENGLYEVRSQSIRQIHRFEDVILSLEPNVHRPGQFYIGFKGGGLSQFSWHGSEIEILEHAFDGYFISDIFHDQSGGLWVTSLFNGIFYYPRFAGIETLALFPNEIITCIEVYDNQLFIGTNTGHFRILEDGAWQTIYKGFETVTSITKVQNSVLVSFTNYSVFFNLENKQERIHTVGNRSYLGRPHTDAIDSLIICAGHRGVALTDLQGNIINKRSLVKSIPTPSRRTNELLCIDNRAIVCTMDGLRIFSLSANNDSLIYNGHALLGKNVRTVSAYKANAIIAATSGSGIYIYENDEVKELMYGGKRIYETPNCMALVNDSMLALGVNHGIILLQLHENAIVNIHTIDKNLGLQTNKSYSLHSYLDGTFLCSSGIGLERLNQEEILSPINAAVILKGVSIDGALSNGGQIKLESSFSELKFEYAALDFARGAYIGYKYRINSESQNWIYTNSNSISLTSLAPGNYTIEVTTALKNINPKGSIVIPFLVKAPFYQTPWFWLVVVVFLALVALLIDRTRRKRAQTAQQLFKMEYRALNSQMNPHFLFNVLGSIQGFIIKGNKTKAYEFISQFASLIRTNLHLSETNEISVSDELDMLHNYLVLEQMRFKDEFDFSIDHGNLEEDMLAELKIPRMLIQPIVENAILHGIRNLTNKGAIDIKLEMTEELRVEIIDNGIGRVASRKINSEKGGKHKSIATKNIEKRLELMKESGRQKVDMETQDLYDANGVAKGTKVVFLFEELF